MRRGRVFHHSGRRLPQRGQCGAAKPTIKPPGVNLPFHARREDVTWPLRADRRHSVHRSVKPASTETIRDTAAAFRCGQPSPLGARWNELAHIGVRHAEAFFEGLGEIGAIVARVIELVLIFDVQPAGVSCIGQGGEKPFQSITPEPGIRKRHHLALSTG